jgi:MFS family permease
VDSQRRRVLSRDFRLLWLGQSTSQIGSFVTVIALPFLAVVTLHASAFEVGVLTFLGYAGALVIGLPAGAWVDRRTRRPVMVVSDLIRAGLLATIPLAAAFDSLTLLQLYVVALLHSVCTVFFDVSYAPYLPTLVGPKELVPANARLEVSASVSAVAAPTLAGFLIQLLTAPVALLFDGVTFLVSALTVRLIRHRETPPPAAEKPQLRREIAEGLRFVFTDKLLRSAVACTATQNVFSAAFDALVILFLVRELRLSAGAIGALLSFGGIGGILGALVTPWFARRVGDTRAIWLSLVLTGPFGLLIPLTAYGLSPILFGVGELGRIVGILIYNITNSSFAQAYTPKQILGRVTATRRVLARGMLAVGALVGGVVGGGLGLVPALWIVVIGQMLAPVWLVLSPMRTMRGLPEEKPMAVQPSTAPTTISATDTATQATRPAGTPAEPPAEPG